MSEGMTKTSLVLRLLPDLGTEEYEALKADISAHGIRVPIVVNDHGHVLDGRHRKRAAKELDILCLKVRVTGLSDDENLELALKLNLLRRQLAREHKQAIAVRLRNLGWTQDRIARVIGVDQRTIGRWLQDVRQLPNVDADSGKSPLPSTIIGTLGRVQPAWKPRRTEAEAPSQPEGPSVQPVQVVEGSGAALGAPSEPDAVPEEDGIGASPVAPESAARRPLQVHFSSERLDWEPHRPSSTACTRSSASRSMCAPLRKMPSAPGFSHPSRSGWRSRGRGSAG